MKKRINYILVGLLSFILLSGSVVLAEDYAQDSAAAQLTAKLHRYFPNVQGTVVSVQDENVFIDLGMEHDLVTGAQLAVLQDGEEIVHPTTGKVLGTYQKLLGTLQVTEVREQFSLARLLWLEAGAELAPGMTVGGIPGRVKVGLLPPLSPGPESQAMQQSFVQALRADERFTVFDEADLRAAALQADVTLEHPVQEQALHAINDVLHAHNFLQLKAQPDAESDMALAQVLVFSPQGEEIGSVQEMFDSSQQSFAQAEPSARPEPAVAAIEVEPRMEADPSTVPEEAAASLQTQEKFWRSAILRMKLHKMAIGDLLGDGKNEVVVATEHDLEILEYGILGEKGNFLPLGNRIEGYNDALILTLGVGDLNGNGRSEIFVTSLRGKSTEVRVFEYDGERFQEIWSKKGLVLRVIHTPAGETYLVGQKTTSSISMGFLSGSVSEYAWDGEEYSRKGRLDVPGRVDVFGFTLADVNADGRNEVLFYDRFDRIDMFQGGGRRWRSRGAYEPYKMYLVRKGEETNRGRHIVGRIELTYLEKDKDLRLILFKNFRPFKFIQGLPLYNGSELYIFRWNGEDFTSEFRSEEFESYIVDYAVADIDNDGKQEIALAMVLKGDDWFRTPQSQIVVYEVEQ